MEEEDRRRGSRRRPLAEVAFLVASPTCSFFYAQEESEAKAVHRERDSEQYEGPSLLIVDGPAQWCLYTDSIHVQFRFPIPELSKQLYLRAANVKAKSRVPTSTSKRGQTIPIKSYYGYNNLPLIFM